MSSPSTKAKLTTLLASSLQCKITNIGLNKSNLFLGYKLNTLIKKRNCLIIKQLIFNNTMRAKILTVLTKQLLDYGTRGVGFKTDLLNGN